MPEIKSHSPLIYTYLKKYQDDPTSRVFAPLAEAYRKSGMVDEAEKIAREGLRVHPQFMGGRVALARTLFDQKKYHDVIDELAEVVRNVPDNLVAQRLLAESHLMIGRVPEALNSFKMLLYYSPHDQETANIVRELESQAYEKGAMTLRTDSEPESTQFQVHTVGNPVPSVEAKHGHQEWMRRIEILQGLLIRLDRNRADKATR